MDPTSQLLRFFYLGTNAQFYIRKKTPVKEDGDKYLHCIKALVLQDPKLPLDLIKAALNDKCVVRNDEPLFALAYCAKKIADENFRRLVYNMVPEIIGNGQYKDLFLFVDYHVKLGSGKASFGHGMKRAVKSWYEKHTPLELAEMFGKNRKFYSWSHKNIFHLIHIRLKDKNQQEVIDAVHVRGAQHLKRLDEEELMERFNQSTGLSRFDIMCRFKSCDCAEKAVEMYKLHNFGFELIPPTLYRCPEIWEVALGKLSYQRVLDLLLILNDYKLLKQEDPLSKKYTFALGNVAAVTESQIHPITIYNKMRLYDVKQRYLEIVKEAHHTANSPSLQACEINPYVLRKLIVAFNHSFSHHPQTGCRYYITMDLRKSYARKKIFDNRLVSCMQASVLLALSILKREKDVTIVTFTDDKDVLTPVEFKTEMTFDQAIDYCEKHNVERTKSDVAQPLKSAMEAQKKVDVFITIIDSLTRAYPTGEPPVEALEEYKKKMNLTVCKYILVNLGRHKQDFKFKSPDVKDILELAGFSHETPKIIEAFAKNQFS